MKDLLECVKEQLQARKGSLRQVAEDTGIAYDTVHRIKNGEGDPGYSKIKTLVEYFGRGCRDLHGQEKGDGDAQ